MLNFLRKVGRVLQDAADKYEAKCPSCGKIFKGQGRIDTCDQCGARVSGSDRGD